MLHTIVVLTAILIGVALLRSVRNRMFSTNPRYRLAGAAVGLVAVCVGSLTLMAATSWIAETRWPVVWDAPAIATVPFFLSAYSIGLCLTLCASLLDACTTWIINANLATQATAVIATIAVIVVLPRTTAGRLGPTITRNALVIATAVGAVLAAEAASLDGLIGLTASTVLPNDTRYASGYTDTAFRHVRPGMTHDEVRALLGVPLHASLTYSADATCLIWLRDGTLDKKSAALRRPLCKRLRVTPAASANDVYRALGTPSEEHWIFSDSPTDTNFRQRIIVFKNGRVASRVAEFYFD